MSLQSIESWHKRARPTVTNKGFNVSVGVHIEEFAEMMEALSFVNFDKTDLVAQLHLLSTLLKKGSSDCVVHDRQELADALADQIVTAVGVGCCSNINVPLAVERVAASNESKFVEGQPVFDANGKIAKGPFYAPPNLDGCY